MTYDQLLYRAYSLAIRLPHLGITNDLVAMSTIELQYSINMMLRLVEG